ncbi:Nicotinate phosphoribosyltransferase pncB2 [archaeon HR06]|nr:Nicotinate phosphoribosyltransferase pncB2 [archaeon HR06]
MDLKDRIFWISKEEEIKGGETTDIYFVYTSKVIREKLKGKRVVMEVYARSLPYEANWGVLCGVYEVVKLLEGLPVNLRAMEEGEVFLVNKNSSIYEPVLQIEANYPDIAIYENPLLGFLCFSSGIATKAARIKILAKDKMVFSFGTRRSHPSIAPTIERAAYLSGFDSVSNLLGAKLMNKRPVGTMPHALIQCFGSAKEAWKAFDEVLDKDIPRIALIDTFGDEKQEALEALEILGNRLYGVRLDTPSSRRGNMKKIIEEVRWELNIRGAKDIKIFVSGGIDEEEILQLRDLVDGFGVGTSVSSAPSIDFSAKIVQVFEKDKWVFRSKKGDIAGRKEVFRRKGTLKDLVTLAGKEYEGEKLLKDFLIDGKIVREFKSLEEIRESLKEKYKLIEEGNMALEWKV